MKFLVTEECGRLARWLRLMGYDAALGTAQSLSALYRQAYNEGRVVVTRNRRIGASCLFRVVQLGSDELDGQLLQLLRDLQLPREDAGWFTRCDVCNVTLQPIEKPHVKSRVAPYVYDTQQAFYVCPACQRVYWAATHWQRARRFLDRVRKEVRRA